MIVLGVLGCVVAAILVVALVFAAAHVDLVAVYRRIAWVPVAALAIQAVLWKPLLVNLSYAASIPPLLTGVGSLFLATVGATLFAVTRARNEETTGLLRATLIAAIPGAILLGLLLYGLIDALLRGRLA